MTPVLLSDLLRVTPAANNRPAIVDHDRIYSRGEFIDCVERMAAALQATGIRRRDRVAIALPKSFAKCVAIFAATRCGGVAVPINPLLKPDQIGHILTDCAASTLVTHSARAAELATAGYLKGRAVLDVDAPLPDRRLAEPASGIGQDLAAILYTSGSTGRPKGVMLSHANLIAGTRIVRTYLGITGQDRILAILPFSFDYGLNQLLTAVEQAATLVLGEVQLGDQLVGALARHEITGLAGVPTLWAMLTRMAPSLKRTPLPRLRYITNSGGAVPEATVRQLRTLLPSTDIYLMYGLTEAFRSTYLPPSEVDRRPTSIGKAIPECEVFPVTSDGRRARPGEAGILVHRGPTVSLGYWNRPEETRAVLRQNPLIPAEFGGDIVCWSGDLVTEDEDGFLYFVGRNDAMIKSAGFRISPTEVEEVLMATGAFRQVAVIGLPDEWTGQRVCAVGIASDSANFDQTAVLAAVAARLPGHMVPTRIDLVDRLPTSPNGKVDYKRLAAERA